MVPVIPALLKNILYKCDCPKYQEARRDLLGPCPPITILQEELDAVVRFIRRSGLLDISARPAELETKEYGAGAAPDTSSWSVRPTLLLGSASGKALSTAERWFGRARSEHRGFPPMGAPDRSTVRPGRGGAPCWALV